MAVSEQDLADILAGVARVHLAVIRGLSKNHPRSAANVIEELRLEAQVAQQDGSGALTSLPARYLLGLLEAKPPNVEESRKQPTRRGPFSFQQG